MNDFVGRFDACISLDQRSVVEKKGRFFLLNEDLRSSLPDDFFYAGVYLGKAKDNVFFPSFGLLAIIADGKANKIMVDEKTEWLFICGRDIFKRGIVRAIGSKKKGHLVLVLNQHGECLGFGKILRSIDEDKNDGKVVVKNILDVGDFLRRER